jgi:hypothetical protein
MEIGLKIRYLIYDYTKGRRGIDEVVIKIKEAVMQDYRDASWYEVKRMCALGRKKKFKEIR